MRFTAAGLATTVGGTRAGPDVPVEGVASDTRSLRPGQLFVPLRDRRDGHDFLAAAVAAGAPAYLTTGPTVPGATAVVVADTGAALTTIGRAARGRVTGAVVGITGSVGKTTVKDLVAGVLATTLRTGASRQSFNNDIGVPLTLANAPDDPEAVVVEMGARGAGHVRALCAVARPTIGVVTRVGQAHTEQFGSLEGVARAKGELVEALPSSGTAVLNADDHRVAAMASRASARVVRYGLSPGSEVTAYDVALDELARPSFVLATPEGRTAVRLQLHGPHQVANALAAAAAGLAAGVPLAAVAEGLAAVPPPDWRMAVRVVGDGVVVVNDAYNANPTSMRAALASLRAMAARRRIAVLGAMAELGASSAEDHREVAAAAAELGIELVPFRTAAYGPAPVEEEAAVVRALEPLGPGDVVLVKGSRAARLESVVEALARAAARGRGRGHGAADGNARDEPDRR